MKVTVTKRFTFEACHFLPKYVGACHNLHGHSYELEVTVSGNVIKEKDNPKYGMILDFKDLKSLVNKIILNKLDHSMLNDIFENPTAEEMSIEIFEMLDSKLSQDNLTLERIKLWETRDSYAEVTREWFNVILSRDI